MPTYSDMTLTVAGNFIAGRVDTGQDLGVLGKQNSVVPLPTFIAETLTMGTGAGKLNLMNKVQLGSLTGTVDIDLSTLTDPDNQAINYARVKVLAILNYATNDAYKLVMGLAASNPWVAPFDGLTTGKLMIPPGRIDATTGITYPGRVLFWANNATGLVVSGTSKVIRLDSGANTVPYFLGLFGNDA
jgi:hypothetical protein